MTKSSRPGCTKVNPGPFDVYGKALLDEPIFTLLGRDPFAPWLVRKWANWAQLNGKDPQQVANARRIADDMEKFRETHTPEQLHDPQQKKKRFLRTA